MCVIVCVGTGNNGSCCLPDGVPCPGYAGCCSGNCQEGVCGNVNVNIDAGMPCATDSDCLNQTPPMVCDFISGTCEGSFCYPPQVAAPGACGTLRQQTGAPLMVKADGTSCQFGANYCSTGSECCTGKCVPCPTQPNRTCCTNVVRW
jgi:hypothetical protein